MAFQAGTRVDPRLMQADYSGFTNAANIQAQALANFGQQIGEGIEKYQKNKEITGVTLASIEGILASNPDLIALGQAEEGSIGKSFNKLQEDGNLNKRSALEVKGYLDTIMESRAAEKKSLMEAATLANVQAKTELAKAQTAAASQSTPKSISTKKLASGQAYLDENNLVIKDGMLYKKDSGYFGFGGSLTPVPNPEAYFNVEGIPELVAQSSSGSNTVMMQPQDGWSSRALDAANAPDGIEEALESVAPKDPTKSNRSAIRANRKPYEPMRYDAPERLIPGGRRGKR
jgi:hypothetical protein